MSSIELPSMASLLKWGGVLALLGAGGTQFFVASSSKEGSTKRAAVATGIMVGIGLLALLYFLISGEGGAKIK